MNLKVEKLTPNKDEKWFKCYIGVFPCHIYPL